MLFSTAVFSQSVGNQNVDVSVYPNPTIENLFIELLDQPSDLTIELTSMIGTKLKVTPEVMGFGKYRISVKDLSSGYYFLIVKSRDERFRKATKFLKN